MCGFCAAGQTPFLNSRMLNFMIRAMNKVREAWPKFYAAVPFRLSFLLFI